MGRQQGLFTTLAYLAFFVLVASGLQGCAEAKRLILTVVIGSVPMISYALVQRAGLDPIPWRTTDKSPVLATIGRSNFVGSYLLMALPFTLAAALLTERRWLQALLAVVPRRLSRHACCLLCPICLFALLLTLLVLVAAHVLRRANRGRLRFYSLIAIGVLAVLAVAYLATANAFGGVQSALVPRLPEFSGSLAARLTIWWATAQLIIERPPFGFGPDGFGTAFYHVFPPQLVFYQGREAQTDQAHNVFLQHAVAAGIPGLLAFLGFVVTLLAAISRGFFAKRASSGSFSLRFSPLCWATSSTFSSLSR